MVRYEYEFNLNDAKVDTQDKLKMLEEVLDNKLIFKAHIREQLKKACARASALRRLRKFNSKDLMVRLYKAYVLPYLEYCSPLSLCIGNAETTKMENTNYYLLRSILGYPKSALYDYLPTKKKKKNFMKSLEHVVQVLVQQRSTLYQ